MLKIKMSLSNDEYKGLEEMWESENVYDRGRQNLPNIPSAVQQQSDEHIFYDSGFSLKVIQNSDLEYDLKNNLGFTKTAKVIFGRLKSYQKDSVEDVAIKILTSKSITHQELISSIGPWAKIKHSNVIEIKGLCPTNDLPLVVMECGKGGVLKDFLRKIEFKLPIKIVLNWALQIVDGMIEIHAKNVMHRDLASGNIVMTNNGETIEEMESNILKLIDLNDKKASGTPLNMSPESFDDIITKESEVYSFGCFLWELLTQHRQQPFEGVDRHLNELTPFSFGKLVGIEGKTLKIPNDCNPELAKLMKKCWKFDPKERPSFFEIKTSLNDLIDRDDLAESLLQFDQYDANQNYYDEESTSDEYSDEEYEEDSGEAYEKEDETYEVSEDDERKDQEDRKAGQDKLDFNIPFLF